MKSISFLPFLLFGLFGQLKTIPNQLNSIFGLKEGDIRLVVGGHISKSQGNVQIYKSKKWGYICDDEWDKAEADVVCRELGLNTVQNVPTYKSTFGQATDRIVIDETFCTGNERRLSECRSDFFGKNECSQSEAAGVRCNVKKFIRKKPIKSFVKGTFHIQLVGGKTTREGRVELKSEDGTWNYICGDGWGIKEANVVCQQMNLGHALNALQVRLSGKVNNIALTGVECQGSESSLYGCLYEHHGKDMSRNCPGKFNNIAGVKCSINLPDLVLNIKWLQSSMFIQDQHLLSLQCAKEENCLSQSAYDNQNYFSHRRLLRFTVAVLNNGTADFKPTLDKKDWTWHLCHKHYHSMEVFAHYELVDPKTGEKRAEGHKASFCLEDNECKANRKKKYVCKNKGDQGISVGCADIYAWSYDCQWIDITGVPSGKYLFKVSVNPEFKLPELSFNNNVGTCQIYYDKSSGKIRHLSKCILQAYSSV
ncbi:Lysyl oxidase 2 [Nymphon striatum]|nr:Lysyl oxidase 2 [Nymphon striatum]